MTRSEIIDEIIAYSDGAYHMHEPEGYEKLTYAEKEEILNEVFQEVYTCDSCGWWFSVDSMENFPDSGEDLCSSCANIRIEEEDEDSFL